MPRFSFFYKFCILTNLPLSLDDSAIIEDLQYDGLVFKDKDENGTFQLVYEKAILQKALRNANLYQVTILVLRTNFVFGMCALLEKKISCYGECLGIVGNRSHCKNIKISSLNTLYRVKWVAKLV